MSERKLPKPEPWVYEPKPVGETGEEKVYRLMRMQARYAAQLKAASWHRAKAMLRGTHDEK